ncbi:hypothetical protein BC629DRAFT_1737845 [Irpex lacteus]|nr:hypothetical protein BC629DRAFT_1737845 [Irpex lacteus]
MPLLSPPDDDWVGVWATPACSATATSSSPHMLPEHIKAPRLTQNCPKRQIQPLCRLRGSVGQRYAVHARGFRGERPDGVQGLCPWSSRPTPPTQ